MAQFCSVLKNWLAPQWHALIFVLFLRHRTTERVLIVIFHVAAGEHLLLAEDRPADDPGRHLRACQDGERSSDQRFPPRDGVTAAMHKNFRVTQTRIQMTSTPASASKTIRRISFLLNQNELPNSRLFFIIVCT